ncbi:MAG: tryptophan 2,3-dioxygenase family protein [Chitinophagales bacterium]|nr:tryptophan 2,3-dioxygenase family protein [Chitinophagales bacterium]
MEITPELAERLEQLKLKYAAMGQDMLSYIDGLLYADYLTYWDYINLDVLLNLQHPRTPFPDEQIFIMYHQVTELYFKLCLHAIKQIADDAELDAQKMLVQLRRINTYFDALIRSFDVMVDGMDKDQFLKFRMALLPASGFQSAQYRMIEICSTPLKYLVTYDERTRMEDVSNLEEVYEHIYWRQGATELASKQKTLTLKQFEAKYSKDFVKLATEYQDKNIYRRYLALPESERKNDALIDQLKQFDSAANIEWPMVHFKSAARYLMRKPEDIKATGGTNWQQYLPPKTRRVTFFPVLWTEEEYKNWGLRSYQKVMGQL